MEDKRTAFMHTTLYRGVKAWAIVENNADGKSQTERTFANYGEARKVFRRELKQHKYTIDPRARIGITKI